VPTEYKMEVDVDAPVEALPNGEATVLDLQDSRGDEEAAEGHPKPQPQQVTSERLPEQDAAVSARKPSAPLTTDPFSPLPTSSGITSVLAPPVLTPGREMQSVSPQQANEGKEASGENDGKDLLNADMDSTTTLVVAERKTTTATLAQDGDETMEISVECGDSPSVAVVSGATIEQPSGSKPTLDKVSPPTTVGVMAVPETGSTETTPYVPPTWPSSDELIRALLGMISNASGSGMDAQVLALHSTPDEKKILTPTSEASLKPSHRRAYRGCLGGGRSTSFCDWEASKVPYS
jgi:hypothetical protein